MTQIRAATLAAQALGYSTRGPRPWFHPCMWQRRIRDPDNLYRTGYSYGRPTNPGFAQPEALLAGLERRAACLTFGSGMVAATSVFLTLRPNDHVIAPR